MDDIIRLFIFFSITVILQIMVSLLLVRLGRSPWMSLVVLPAGFFVHLIIIIIRFPVLGDEQGATLPITSAAIFIAGSLLYTLWFAIAAGGFISPSGRILVALLRRGELPRRELILSVSEEELLTRRIRRLVKNGLVLQHKGRLFLTVKGKQFLFVAGLTGNVLGYHELPVGGWSWI